MDPKAIDEPDGAGPLPKKSAPPLEDLDDDPHNSETLPLTGK